jgi:uncharacterized protein YqgC (DUF456 family)
VPGPPLIWIGALLWAIGDGFQAVGWPTLIVMALLMAAGWGLDLYLTAYFTRRGSSSWLTVLGAIVGGILGGLFLSALPFIGWIAGAIIGAVLGVLVVELLRQRQLRPALESSKNYLIGCMFGQMVELLFVLMMVLLFIWQVTSYPPPL